MRTRGPWIWALALLGIWALALLAGCGSSAGPPAALPREFARHIVMVTLGRFRADHLSLFGGVRNTGGERYDLSVARLERDHTLGVLARQGMSFSNAFVPSGTLEGGLRGWLFGEDAADLTQAPMVPSLAETLERHGWRTAAFTSGYPLESDSVLLRGFGQHSHRAFAHELPRVIDEWAPVAAGERAFVWVHLDLPSGPDALGLPRLAPYLAEFGGDIREGFPGELEAQRVREARYDARLAYLHDMLRFVLWSLSREGGILPDALLAVTSERGCELGEREGYVGPDRSARDAALRVPLVLRAPAGIPANLVEGRVVAAADLYPTVLRAVNLAAPPGLSGRDLQRADPDRVVHGVSSEGAWTLRTNRYRLVLPADDARAAFHRGIELYDLRLPSGARRDVAALRPDVVGELAAYR